MIAASAVLAGWAAWFFGVPVRVVEVSESARLEVGESAYPVAATAAGVVVESRVELGRAVKEGDVLVELDAHALSLALDERRAAIAAVEHKLGPLRDEIAALERAIRDAASASAARVDEARARSRESAAGARFAESEAERQKLLRAEGLAREVDVDRAEADRAARHAEVDAMEKAEARVVAEEREKDSELRGRLARLRREQADLAGSRGTEEAAATSLEHAVEARKIRAPIAGTLGDVVSIPRGTVLKEGDRFASVVPEGELRVTASFPPATAFGRIHPGQRARLMLDGFPWAQYGEVRAEVSRVASEPREGKARVELTVLSAGGARIPMEHGLTGTVEIEVERALPAALVLRAAGQALRAGREDKR